MAIDVEIVKLFAYQFTWRVIQGAIPAYESSRNKIIGDDVLRRFATSGAEILGVYSQVDPDSKWARLNGVIQGAYLGFPGNMIAAGTAEVEKSIIAQFRFQEYTSITDYPGECPDNEGRYGAHKT